MVPSRKPLFCRLGFGKDSIASEEHAYFVCFGHFRKLAWFRHATRLDSLSKTILQGALEGPFSPVSPHFEVLATLKNTEGTDLTSLTLFTLSHCWALLKYDISPPSLHVLCTGTTLGLKYLWRLLVF